MDEKDEAREMGEFEVAQLLRDMLEAGTAMDDEDRADVGLPDECGHVETVVGYREGGYLTRDAGFVVTLRSGAKFEVSVVRSN